MSVMCPTLPRSVSRSKQRDVHPANGKKSSIALKVFQNHPFFICMYTTRSQLERVGGCARPMLEPALLPLRNASRCSCPPALSAPSLGRPVCCCGQHAVRHRLEWRLHRLLMNTIFPKEIHANHFSASLRRSNCRSQDPDASTGFVDIDEPMFD